MGRTVKLAECKGKARFLGRLCKQLVLDLQIADGHGVLVDGSLKATGSVPATVS